MSKYTDDFEKKFGKQIGNGSASTHTGGSDYVSQFEAQYGRDLSAGSVSSLTDYGVQQAVAMRDRMLAGDKMYWLDENDPKRLAAEQAARNQAWRDEPQPNYQDMSVLGKAWDIVKNTVKGSGKGIMSNLAGAEAAIAGKGTILNDTYAMIRSVLDRNDGVSAGEAIRNWDQLGGARMAGVIPQAVNELSKEVRWGLNKLGANVAPTNKTLVNWDQRNRDRIAAAEKNFYDKVGEVNNVYSAGQQKRQAEQQAFTEETNARYADSPAAQNIYKYGTMVGTQLPNIALSIAMAFTGNAAGAGATLAGGMAPATTQGLQFISAFNNSSKLRQLGMLAGNSVREIAASPQYWSSVSMETGSAYNEAIEAGVDPGQASAYAVSYGLLSGIIEVGGADEAAGGLEKMPKKVREAILNGDKAKAAWEYGKTIIHEIGEEEWQEMLSNAMRGGMLGEDVPVFSTKNENAIINPKRMGQTALDTAITTALMGAGERAIVGGTQGTMDSRTYRGETDALLDTARQVAGEQDAVRVEKIGKSSEKKGRMTIGQARQLYSVIDQNNATEQYRSAAEERRTQMLSDWIDQRFADEGLNEDQIRVLKEGYETGEAGAADYAEGVANAFNYGKQRLTLEQARKSAEKSGSRLNDVQFEHAYRLGLGTVTEVADTQTEEGRTKVLANLRALGTQAEAAAEAYEPTQDVKMYARAMGKAIQAYAANGADLKAIWQATKDGQTGNEIQYLTEAQIETAQRLGAEFREEQMQLAEQKDAKLAADRQKVQNAIRQAGTGSVDTAGLSTAIVKIQDNITSLREEIRGTEEGLTLARQAQPGIENTAEYQESEAKLQERRKELQGYQELLKRANQISAKAAKKTKSRKKGKVTYATEAGEVFGAPYSAVDRSKLSETQKATARIAESIAEATGLDIRIVSFNTVESTDEKGNKVYRRFGGEYIPGTGGVMYINIDMNQNGKNMAAGSMFHELTHWLQEYAPKRYEELKRFVLQEMQKNPDAYEDIFNARRGTEGYSKINPDKITDEMVANACMRVFEDADAVKRLVTQHKTLGQQIRDFFVRLVEDIRAAFSEIDFSEDFNLYREAQTVEGAMEEIRDLWISAFEEATENLQAQKTVSASKNTATEGGEVQYQAAEREEILHLQDQIRENMWRFEGKPVLATVNSEIAFNENNIGEAVSWIAEKIGAPVTIQRKGFGQVTFTKKRINQGFNYMPGKKGSKGRNAIGQALTTACVAAPEVVINGVQIGHHSDHKGTGVQTWTFAGPVEIDGERGIMAVVVRKTNQNYYKVHRILTPSGDIMVLDNNKAEVSGGGSPENRTLAQPKLSAEDSIADAEETVKGERQLQAWDAAESEQEERQIQRVQYSVFEEDPETLAWLNKQEKDGDVVHTYKSFLEIDGKLYPPMASMKKGPDGKWKMAKAMEVGRWEKSVGDPSKIEVDPKNGRGYFTLKKDDGSTVKAAYNPYQHSSNLMINDQFTGAYSRPGLVTYECIIPKSELTSGYRAEYAKDAVGVHSWKAGPVAGKLIKAKGTERQVYLSRWLKPVRKVPDAEVAQHYKELLDGTDIAVPSNVVPPSLLHALEDAGVKIEYDPRAPKAQFQMISEVEETDRLVAVHNKSVSGLRRMLKRGGVPFPSIAIKRAGTAHQGFGDVSIVFPKSTIDPEVNRQNRLYSNDAWTPTEPRTEYEVDIPYKIKQRIEESVGSDLFTALNGYSYLDDGDVARALENSTGNLFEAMKGRRILKYAYLKSIGKEPEITQKEADLDGSHKYKNEQLLRIFEQIPADEIENANWDSDDTLKKIADVLNEQFLEKIQDPEKRERIRNSEKLMPYSADKISIGYIKSALFKYRQNGNRAGTEIDTYELDRVLRDNTEVERDPGYKAWIEKTFGKVIKNEGIPNGKDPYTSSGNRRSFKQTHVPATLENIVAQMQKEQERGIGLGGINLRGAATRTYKTVEEMRADRGRLLGERVSDDVYDSYMKGFYGRLHDMSDRVKSGSSISAYDSAEQILLEVLRDSTSKAQMGRKLQAEGRWIRLYDGLTDELWQLKQDVQNMPAPYFEAKPRRVVYPEEALAYIIPDSSEAADVREMLEEDGRYKVLTYKAGDESDRLRVLNSVEGAQFQRWDEPGAEVIRTVVEDAHPWPGNFPPVMYSTNLRGLNREGKALHEQAKNGDAEAARRIVARSVKPEKLSAFAKQYRGARLVAVRSEDGKNKIPYAYAAELAKYGLDIDDSIVQVAKAWHTGSNGIIRMIEHAGFDGDVKPGQEYILVDDVLTFGGTLNDLRMYIESKGGKVVACTTLAVGRNGHHLAIRPELVQQIYDKHGENIDTVLREEGIAYDVSSLTDRQGRYIRDLDVDTLRDRGAQERASEEYRGGKETGSREAEELTETGSRPVAVQYQQYDDTYQDTEAESNERALSYTRLQNENAMLVDIIDKMSAAVKGKDKTIEKILKKLARSRRSDAERLAKQLMKEYGSKADLGEVAAAIKEVGDYFVQTPTESLNPEQAKELARKAAGLIAQNAEDVLEETRDEVYGQIRDSIKGRKLSIRPEYAGELDQYGGYNSFKKANAGKFTLTRADRVKNADEFVSVDQFYQDLNRTYGEAYFPEAGSDGGPVNEGEMVKIIADAFEAGEPIVVNPFEAYMGEATEMIANTIAFRVLNDNVLKPLLPAEAEKAFDQLKAATGENAELRKALDLATTRGEVMEEELERLQKEGRLSKKELVELRDEVYELTNALKKADQEYTALQEQAEQRLQQVKEEGRARVTEVKARERERAAKQISELKKHYQELQKRARERREESAGTRKYREQVKRKAATLHEMLIRNDDKHHVPEVLKRPVAEFLESLDFTSKRALRGGDETKADLQFGERLRQLERMLSGQQSYIDGSSNVQADLGGYVDISEENMDYLRTCIEMVDEALKMGREFTINSMNAQQLKQLSNFLSNLNTAIRNLNHFMANARFESIREAAGQDIEQMKKLGNVGERETGKASGFLMWENGTPYYVFRRFGKGGESIFDGFARGWEKMAFRAKEIMAFTENLYTDKEVRDWKTKVHEFTLSDGSKMKITTAQIMELSMLLNREQALKHIEAGGIQIGDIQTKKGTKISTAQYHLTMEDILQITGTLDARQRKVAKALQGYMARKGAEWGNEISMRRFGYNFYTEGENYYPIKTVPTDRPMSDQDLPQNASMFRLLNLSSSKSLNPHANNALVVGNIFDTFADHMSDMAKLNGMGLPILDAIKYFNYKEKIPGDGKTFTTETMQAAIKQAYGPKALSYFRKLMQDINGTTESGDRGDPGFGKLLSNYKIAAVGANLRVALLQPTSYVRATAVLKPQYMVGIIPSRAAYQEAVKYSGTAVWKSLGYYDTDIARGMRGQIQHDDTWKDKVAEASMKATELGDQLTWSMLWTACKRQAKGENSNLRGQALMDRTADLFREVVYASQVMDSTLTRSEIMRGKTHFTKAASAFMAEPTLSYNILLDAYSQFRTDERKAGRGAAWQKNGGKIGKAFAVYVSSAAFAAIVESLVDAMRDDDDDEAVDKFLQAFLGDDALSSEAGMLQRLKSVWLDGNLGQDLTIIGKLPFIKDIMSILQGYGAGNMATDGIESVMKAIDILKGNGSKRLTPWGKIYKYLQPISQLSGLAISNLSRDAVAIWNATAGTINPDMKLRKYDAIAFTDEMQAGYDEYVKPTGISKAQFQRILSAANTDGNTSVKQDEMGAWLVDALAANEITEEQAQALWKSQWNKEKSKTFDKWRGTEPTSTATSPAKSTSTTKSISTTKTSVSTKSTGSSQTASGSTAVADYASFKTATPIYGDEATAAAYNAKPAGMSLARYAELLKKADTNGNDSIVQDEMGYMLRDAVISGEMSFEEAEAIWRSQWNKPRSKTLSKWAADHP